MEQVIRHCFVPSTAWNGGEVVNPTRIKNASAVSITVLGQWKSAIPVDGIEYPALNCAKMEFGFQVRLALGFGYTAVRLHSLARK